MVDFSLKILQSARVQFHQVNKCLGEAPVLVRDLASMRCAFLHKFYKLTSPQILASSRIHTFMLCVCLDAKDELPDFARGLAFQEAVVKGLFHIGFAIKANLPSKLMK